MDAPLKSQEQLQKLRVVDLRKELSGLGLSSAGKKDELVVRLHQHYVTQSQEAAAEGEEESTGESNEVQQESEPMQVDDTEAESMKEQEKLAEEKLAEEKRLAAEKQLAEEMRIAEGERMAEEKRLVEESRLAEEKAVAEQKRLAEERVAEEKRIVEEKAAAEAKRVAEEKAAAEAKRVVEEKAAAEAKRVAEEKAAAEAKRMAEEKADAEEKRVAEEKAAAEEKRVAKEAAVEERRLAEEKAAAEQTRLMEETAAEKKRLAEEQNVSEQAEEQRRIEVQQMAQAAEQQRIAEEQKAAEQQHIAGEQRAAEQQIMAAEQLRLSNEQETLKAMTQQQTEQIQTDPREQEMMLLVQQQRALLEKQKSAHEANQRQARQLTTQRQQLETALRQNSVLQSENKSNHAMLEQLQKQRQQLLAQGEAISSQQSTVSEQATAYSEQRARNEHLMKQVMEQQQLKESEQQRVLLLERQQRLVAEHEQFQIAQQQAMEQQAKRTELLRQQQMALLDRQREQEQAVRRLQQEQQQRREQQEVEQRRALVMRREAELRMQKEAAAAAAAAKKEADKKKQQEKSSVGAPPSLLTMDTKPATVGLKLSAPTDANSSDRKLPKALEDVLAMKDIRAKEVGVEDMEQAVVESRSAVTVKSTAAMQLPLGDVNEYDDDEEEDAGIVTSKVSKNKRRKKKKKSRATRKAEEKRAAEERAAAADKAAENAEDDSGVEVEYVQEKPLVDVTNPLYSQFHKIFETFQIEEASATVADIEIDVAVKEEKKPDADSGIFRRGAALFGELENDDEDEVRKRDDTKMSKKQMKKQNRMSVADLKTVVFRPDLVEMHDVTGPDPKLLLSLKATRNTVPVPRHWCNKRKYLQGKRGFEKPPFELPDYIQATGIMEMRQALADKESDKSMKQKMREKVRPKMGKIDIDYQKLHDAFFKYQRKPKMTVHGDLYYEGKEFETKLREKKPGNLTDELRTALGMPIVGAERFPPPWLIAMQRYGPPPSYPNLKIPGLNAAIPEGCTFGYHAGGWGKPPVDETGKPLYGDVFGQRDETEAEPASEDTMDTAHWGEMESESEDESDSESEEERDEDEMAAGLVTPADAGLITPSGLTSIPAGMETPDAIELRKKIEDSMDAGGGDTPSLYQVLPEKRTSVGAAMMGSAHTYDVGGAKKVTAEGVEVTLNPEELDMDTVAMQAKYDMTVRQQQADIQKEDFSDMVAEHSAKAAKKRKKQQTSDKASKKHKEFKF